jgi:DNA-binding transcriptional regulator YdaS (Cro superfamily)
MDALSTAIERAGGVTALASLLDVVPSAVTNWRRRGRVPADFACLIESATGVTVRELRPDLFATAHSRHAAQPRAQKSVTKRTSRAS